MKKLFISAVLLIGAMGVNAQVVINEIMQSNIDCIMDDLNDFPDSWVELYNAGEEAVNLKDYKLGTKADKPKKADQLPDYTLEPGAFYVIYCDKALDDWESYKAPEKRESVNRHMSFRLESGKDCKLYLYLDKEMVDSVPEGMKKQPAPNIAYGRKKDGGDKWGYQAVPTPGAANCGTVYGNKDIVGTPVFSVAGKVFTSGSFDVEISLPEDSPEGTVIRYTTDFSEPTADSKEYTEPIKISGSTVIKAKLFCDGKLSPWSTTQSYLKMDHDVTLPVVSISTNDKYLYDDKIGIYVDGTYTYTGGGGWWGGGGNEEDKNFFYNWRRPINIEYFEGEETESAINQLGEMRIAGGYTRRNALKTLAVYANKRFGENKRLKYEFFPDQRPGDTDFKSIMLRDAGNDYDYLYMRDAIIQCSMAKYLDLDWQAWRPIIIYINGKYKGMLNIRERSNEDNIYTHYKDENGDGLEDLDMIENWWELKEGDIDSWNEFQAFYKETGHTYEEFDEKMDVQEFMDIMIINSFIYNTDFPGNNIVLWRPQADGGRWRVILKDTDFGLGLYDANKYKNNYFDWLYKGNEAGNSADGTRLFRRLMETEKFKREFIDRCAIYAGDFMNYDRIWETWEPMYEMTKYELTYHRKVNTSWVNYSQEMSSAQNFLKKRPGYFYDQLSSYFKLGGAKELTINKDMDASDLEKISVKFNGWELSRGTFDGKFFEGREVTLESEGIYGWRISTTANGNTEETIVTENPYKFEMPNGSVKITTLLTEADGIDEVYSESASEVKDIYDAAGIRRNNLQKGLNIIRTKDGKSKSVWK